MSLIALWQHLDRRRVETLRTNVPEHPQQDGKERVYFPSIALLPLSKAGTRAGSAGLKTGAVKQKPLSN